MHPTTLPGPLRAHAHRSVRRLIVWCLLVSVPLYGFSASLIAVLGSTHVHVGSVQVAALVEPPPAAVNRDSAGNGSMLILEDFRRVSSAHPPTLHAHSHSAFERHHHAPDDATVRSLDGGHHGGAGSDEGGGSTTLSHVLALSDIAAFAVPALPAFAWTASTGSALDPWMGEGLERPPRA